MPDENPIGTRMLVEVQLDVRYEHVVDLVAYYDSLPPRDREAYEQFVRTNANGYAAWEHPVAWLYPQPDRNEILDDGWLAPHAAVVASSGDESDWNDFMRQRIGVPRHAPGRARWDEEDYLALCQHVDWLNVLRRSTLASDDPDALTAEDVGRIPGPNDVGLFE